MPSGGGCSSELLFVIGAVLVGLYEGCGALVVGGVATCQGTTNSLIHLSAALPLNIVMVLLVVYLQPTASVVFSAMLPLCSACCYVVFMARGGNSATLRSTLVARGPARSSNSSGRSPFGRDWRFLLVVFLVASAFGLVNVRALSTADALFSPLVSYTPLLIRAAVSAVVFGGYVRFSWRPYSLFGAALLLMAVGLVACGVAGLELASLVFLAGYLCFDVLIWALCIMLNHRSGMPLLRTICIVYAIDQIGVFVGTSLGVLSSGSLPFAANSVEGICVVLGSLLLLLMVWMSSGKSPLKDGLASCEVGFDMPRNSDEEGVLAEMQGSVSREGALKEIASRYFLSAREIDVLTLLVAGRNGPYIAEHLCVSDNTVKTHVRHIYTKLDVHNRQELLDLVLSFE